MSGPGDLLWFRALTGFVVGLCLGSFATMLSYRLPRHISIIRPGSHCPACKKPLSARELVPVLSWVAQKGRCRVCGAFSGWRYPLIELVTAAAGIAAFMFFGFSWVLLPALVLIVALVTVMTQRMER